MGYYTSAIKKLGCGVRILNTTQLIMENLKELDYNEIKGINGGVHWWIPVAIGIAYNEINDIWESGGKNLTDAYNDGKEWAENN